jgi:hypothetical protein
VLQVDQEQGTRFDGTLPTTEDYFINVVGSNQMATDYSLSVAIP